MKHPYLAGAVLASMVSMAMGLPRAALADEADLDCKLRFSLTGWSVIYKHAEGHGVVSCANGKTMSVKIEAHGGGLTVGKSHIDNGTGKFTDVHKIQDVLGTYAQGDASIGAGADQGHCFARARRRRRRRRHRRQLRRIHAHRGPQQEVGGSFGDEKAAVSTPRPFAFRPAQNTWPSS
jgi:hypothetical protein